MNIHIPEWISSAPKSLKMGVREYLIAGSNVSKRRNEVRVLTNPRTGVLPGVELIRSLLKLGVHT